MTTTNLPECYGREWATRSDPTCAKCSMEPACGPLFATGRLLKAAEALGMQVPRPAEAERLAKECGTTPEAILSAIDYLAQRAEKSRAWSPQTVSLPAVAKPVSTAPSPSSPTPASAPEPKTEEPVKKRGRPKGSKNKAKPQPTSTEEIARLASTSDSDDFPTVDVKVIEAEEIGSLVASLPPEEAAEVVAVQEAGSASRAAAEAAIGRYSMSAPEGSSDERLAQDRGWCPGQGHALNLTTGAMELVDWPGFPALLRRPDTLAPVLQITFWSVPLGKWVWLVDSASGREIPEGVVELTWRDLVEAGFAQRLRKESPEASIRAVIAARG